MWKLRRSFCLISLLLLCSLAALVAAKGSRSTRRNWQTLKGDQPLVIARGGFSGVFADSSSYAYQLAVLYGSPDLHAWCNVQLTKDGKGICFPYIKLDNASTVNVVYETRSSTYQVNGETVKGWFSVDFTLDELALVSLQQNIYSRAPYFDTTPMPILTVDDVTSLKPSPPKLWLNIPYDAFFTQRNLSMRDFVISVSRSSIVNYISSPEVGFLRSIVSRFRRSPTKLVFQILERDKLEPSTNQTYDSLLKNLTFIKTFAAGILVPKSYIWPEHISYLSDSTNLVTDAHMSGLEVFASTFVNDVALPYDYSYDPVAEYIKFVDNDNFSVDGVLSDFPLTATAAIECLSHMGMNDTVQANISVISSEGASGDFPGCTDLAYDKAISDGVDILDCPVQVTNDGIPFCLGSIDLKRKTNAAESDFINKATTNADLNMKDGIFAYNLTWNEIQTLKPAISSPYVNYSLFRNPKARNDGKFQQLSDFLSRANNAPSVSGLLISIENAVYLAKKQGLGVTDLVLDTLNKAGFTNQTAKKIMIKSSDSAVLEKIKGSNSNYELVYEVDKDVRDILNETISEIKTFATAVVVSKESVFPTDGHSFIKGETTVVSKLQAFGLPVYVKLFQNEFVSQAWDYFTDPYVEINTHVSYMEINGVITEFPGTAAKFKRNRCLGYKTPPNYMSAVQSGGLLQFVTKDSMAPAEAPYPILKESDVAESPLPSVVTRPTNLNPSVNSTAPGQSSPNGQPMLSASTVFTIIFTVCSAILLRP